MPECTVCQTPFVVSKTAKHKLTCSPECAGIRKKTLQRENRKYVLNQYDRMGLTALEACQTLEPVTRRQYTIIMENFLGNLMSLEDEVAMVFAEASTWGRGMQIREESLL